MFLSRLTLNTRSAKVRRDISNPYELHRTLSWGAHSAESERALWRLETSSNDVPIVLVQTRLIPDWARICSNSPDYFLRLPETKEVHPRLSRGMILRFRVRGNPCRKQDGRRIGLNSREEQVMWLKRKAACGGFTVLSADLADERLVKATKPDHQIQMASVLYDGTLRVDDTELFERCIYGGVGPGKGLGFGLLSIAPANS